MQKSVLLNELAKLFDQPHSAKFFLEDCGFNLTRLRPPFGEMTAYEYWYYIAREVDSGTLAGGYNVLIRKGLERYPHNQELAAMLAENTRITENNGAGQEGPYDVFISCNSKDGAVVECIVNGLIKEVRVWYYKNDVAPSTAIVNALDRILNEVEVTLVLLGKNGKGAWQDMEIAMAVDQHTRKKMAILPVVLPGATIDDLPLSLRQFSGIVFGSSTVEAVVQEITGALKKGKKH